MEVNGLKEMDEILTEAMTILANTVSNSMAVQYLSEVKEEVEIIIPFLKECRCGSEPKYSSETITMGHGCRPTFTYVMCECGMRTTGSIGEDQDSYTKQAKVWNR